MTQQAEDLVPVVSGNEEKSVAIYEPAMKRQQAVALFNQIMEFTKEALHEGINSDYATIPGTKKPTLLKAGAEKLNIWFNLIPDPFITVTEKIPEDSMACGFILSVDTTVILRDKQGNIRGQCQGNCNSGEDKYREQTRWLTEKKLKDQGLLSDGLEHDDRPSQFGDGKGTYRVYKVIANPNPYQLLNTLKKMSQKRAYVGASIQATATSGIFSQDMEDTGNGDNKKPPKAEKSSSSRKAEPSQGELLADRDAALELAFKAYSAGKLKQVDYDGWKDKIDNATSKTLSAMIKSLKSLTE